MSFLESIKSAFSSIMTNKLRSLLTMLGIIIGISAVITITTLGSSLTATIQNVFSQFGGNYVDISVSQAWIYDEGSDFSYPDPNYKPDESCITLEMLNELNERYPDCYINTSINGIGSCTLVTSDNKTVRCGVMGAFDGYLKTVFHANMLAGRDLTPADNLEVKYSILVSDIFVKQYFTHGEEPLGKTLSFTSEISGASIDFTIVGVYRLPELQKKMMFGSDKSDEELRTYVFIPYSVASALSGETTNGFQDLELSLNPVKPAADLEQNLEAFFHEKFDSIRGTELNFWSDVEDFDITMTTIRVVTLIISIIAAISLLVGGVGVMNIMLVSVTERTREIGIRKALGAKKSNIRLQFVIEAIVICLIGGIIGILIGILNSEIIGAVAKILVQSNEDYGLLFDSVKIVPSLAAILISVVFSTLTGIFFGLYPANKAAKMNPIDALRYD